MNNRRSFPERESFHKQRAQNSRDLPNRRLWKDDLEDEDEGEDLENHFLPEHEHSYFIADRNQHDPSYRSSSRNDWGNYQQRQRQSRNQRWSQSQSQNQRWRQTSFPDEFNSVEEMPEFDYSSSRYSVYGGDQDWISQSPNSARRSQEPRRTESFQNQRFGQDPEFGMNLQSPSQMGEGLYQSVKQRVKSFFGKGPKGYKKSDERIKEDISEAFYHHPLIDAGEIEIEVRDGIVTLRGGVDSRRTKRLAEDLAEDFFGVVEVTNELRVKARDINRGIEPEPIT